MASDIDLSRALSIASDPATSSDWLENELERLRIRGEKGSSLERAILANPSLEQSVLRTELLAHQGGVLFNPGLLLVIYDLTDAPSWKNMEALGAVVAAYGDGSSHTEEQVEIASQNISLIVSMCFQQIGDMEVENEFIFCTPCDPIFDQRRERFQSVGRSPCGSLHGKGNARSSGVG